MKIGRYEILDEIGQGAMGTVYRARDPLIERTVAIKTVPIAQLQQEGADAESRFLREAQSAGRLSHPNIVTIYDVGEADGLAYIAMEYLPGRTLRDLMEPPDGRPPVFYRGYDVYDQARVGFLTNVAEEGGRRFFLYDTSLPGNSNAGHLYGTALPDEDKAAIVEYLKTF